MVVECREPVSDYHSRPCNVGDDLLDRCLGKNGEHHGAIINLCEASSSKISNDGETVSPQYCFRLLRIVGFLG